jgi:hypothetical protein
MTTWKLEYVMPRALRRFGTKTFITTVDLRLLRALLERHAAYLGEVLDYFTCRSEATTRNVLLAYLGSSSLSPHFDFHDTTVLRDHDCPLLRLSQPLWRWTDYCLQ